MESGHGPPLLNDGSEPASSVSANHRAGSRCRTLFAPRHGRPRDPLIRGAAYDHRRPSHCAIGGWQHTANDPGLAALGQSSRIPLVTRREGIFRNLRRASIRSPAHDPDATTVSHGRLATPASGGPTPTSYSCPSFPWPCHMLIDKDWVSIRVQQKTACRARGRFIGLGEQVKALALEGLLDVPHVVKVRQGVAATVPAGVERQGVFLEHPLEQSDRCGLVLKDQPILGGITHHGAEAELLVERT